MKVSLFYGKKIESTAGSSGYVICVNVSGWKLVSLTCADGNEKLFTVRVESVKSVKDKLVYTDKCNTVKDATPLRLGKPVFDCEGTYLGKLTDFSVEKNIITYAHVGTKKFSADDIVCGDAVLVKSSARILKSNVKKNGKVLIKRGTPLTPELVKKAQNMGEYVQTNLKTI